MHRNFRIQACFCFVYFTIQICCRFILLYYELNDIPNSREDQLLFWVETVRAAIITYFCSVPGSFVFERFVATHYWAWYERSSPSTLWIFVIVELSNTVPAFSCSWFIYTQRISKTTCFLVIVISAVIWLIVFLRTYLVNLKALRQISKGATINFYSVSRTFQVNENVEIMTYMVKIAFSTFAASSLSLAVFAIYLFAPVEWRFARNMASAFFDLGIVIAGATCTLFGVIGNRRIHNEFKKLYPFSALYGYFASREKISAQSTVIPLSAESDTYFSQFAKSWN